MRRQIQKERRQQRDGQDRRHEPRRDAVGQPLHVGLRRLGVADRVSFAGWVQHEQVVDFCRRADIFCFPSIREFGGAVAMSTSRKRVSAGCSQRAE